VQKLFFPLMMGVTFVLAAVHALAVEPTKDSVQTLKQNLTTGKAVLIDVREIDEWNDGHLAAAAFLPLSQIERGVSAEQLAKIAPAGKIVYLHCAFGSRSVTAAKYLSKTGRDVRPLKQGYDDLLEAGFRQAAK
jgi:phage shock protein E